MCKKGCNKQPVSGSPTVVGGLLCVRSRVVCVTEMNHHVLRIVASSVVLLQTRGARKHLGLPEPLVYARPYSANGKGQR